MKKQTFIFTLLTVVLTAGLLLAQEQPAEELSNTRYAEVKLRISTDPKTFPMGMGEDSTLRLRRIMYSPDIAQATWREIIGTSVWKDHVNLYEEEPVSVGGLQMLHAHFSIRLSEEQNPAAKEFLETYIEKLRSALQKEYDFARELHIEKLLVYRQRRDNAERYLNNLLDAQSKLAQGSGKLDKESVRQRILEHERAIIENDMQHAMLRKRAEELVKQIENAHRTTDQIEAIREAILELMEKRDQISTEYKRLDFERSQYADKDPGASKAIIDEITNQLSNLETKLNEVNREIDRLSKHEGQLEIQTTGDIQELNRQLRETNIQLEELEIQERILAGYSPGSLEDSINYEMLEVQIEAAKENLSRAIIQGDEASLEFDLLQPPTVHYDKIIFSETVPEDD